MAIRVALAAGWLLSMALHLAMLYAALIAFDGLRAYDLDEMDWNGDGDVDLLEVLEAADVGTRTRADCTEYYSPKDGLTVRVSCK